MNFLNLITSRNQLVKGYVKPIDAFQRRVDNSVTKMLKDTNISAQKIYTGSIMNLTPDDLPNFTHYAALNGFGEHLMVQDLSTLEIIYKKDIHWIYKKQ